MHVLGIVVKCAKSVARMSFWVGTSEILEALLVMCFVLFIGDNIK